MNKGVTLWIMFCGFSFLYIALVIGLDITSDNKWDNSSNFLPGVEARIDFFQDSFRSQPYSASWSSFWSSENYFNNTFDTATVSLQWETPPVENNISTIVTTITRSSH